MMSCKSVVSALFFYGYLVHKIVFLCDFFIEVVLFTDNKI